MATSWVVVVVVVATAAPVWRFRNGQHSRRSLSETGPDAQWAWERGRQKLISLPCNLQSMGHSNSPMSASSLLCCCCCCRYFSWNCERKEALKSDSFALLRRWWHKQTKSVVWMNEWANEWVNECSLNGWFECCWMMIIINIMLLLKLYNCSISFARSCCWCCCSRRRCLQMRLRTDEKSASLHCKLMPQSHYQWG